jgi:hypothetical protein
VYNAAESSKLTTETFDERQMVKTCFGASDGMESNQLPCNKL